MSSREIYIDQKLCQWQKKKCHLSQIVERINIFLVKISNLMSFFSWIFTYLIEFTFNKTKQLNSVPCPAELEIRGTQGGDLIQHNPWSWGLIPYARILQWLGAQVLIWLDTQILVWLEYPYGCLARMPVWLDAPYRT